MNGVLLVDKPIGLTSHDVVQWARRLLGQRDIGHAGTLDPLATGLLVVLVGRATRLSRYLTGKDKSYVAEVRLGFGTTTDDATGAAAGPVAEVPPSDRVRDVFASFLGEHQQRPPAHSAKKVSGQPAYDAARRGQPLDLPPVAVSVRALEVTGLSGDVATVRLTVSAGFYVRALARDVGIRLGCGGHLTALRRTASGQLSLADALTLSAGEVLGKSGLEARLLTPAEALDLPTFVPSEALLSRIRHGNAVGIADIGGTAPAAWAAWREGDWVRVLSPAGELVAVAKWRGGSLHPATVLG